MKKIFFISFFISILFIMFGNAGASMKKELDNSFILDTEIQGNFTNSGNKEILYIYQDKKSLNAIADPKLGINTVICCVCNDVDEIVKTYLIPFPGSLAINKSLSKNMDALNTFCKPIIIGDVVYGYIGNLSDINDYDTVCLYRLTGWYFYPEFYKFDSKLQKFVSVISYTGGADELEIEKIIPQKNQIIFRAYGPGPNQEGQEIITYTWDEASVLYVITNVELYFNEMT